MVSVPQAYRALDEAQTKLRVLEAENQTLRDRLQSCESALAAAVSDRDDAKAAAAWGRLG
jgi:septal ring factor EnvC (AmiA/AmiB activator)